MPSLHGISWHMHLHIRTYVRMYAHDKSRQDFFMVFSRMCMSSDDTMWHVRIIYGIPLQIHLRIRTYVRTYVCKQIESVRQSPYVYVFTRHDVTCQNLPCDIHRWCDATYDEIWWGMYHPSKRCTLSYWESIIRMILCEKYQIDDFLRVSQNHRCDIAHSFITSHFSVRVYLLLKKVTYIWHVHVRIVDAILIL